MTSTEIYTALSNQARQASENIIDAFENGAKSCTDQMSTVDLIASVTLYFESVQKAVDIHRGLTTSWAKLVNAFDGSVREQVGRAAPVARDQTGNLADLTMTQAEKVQQAAENHADAAEEAPSERTDEHQQG